MKRLVLIEIAIIFICCACRKYEDGPWFSLTSPEKIVDGDWKVTKVLIDNIDKTFIIDSLSIEKYSFKYDKECVQTGNCMGEGSFYIYDKLGNTIDWHCTPSAWGLSDNEKTLYFPVTGPQFLHPIVLLPCYFNYINDASYHDEWKILRLAKKEMTLENNKWGIDIKMFFKKI